MRRIIVGSLTWILFLVAWPLLRFRRKTGAGWKQRLAWDLTHIPPRVPDRPRIWLHGASAGDLLALEPIARSLKTQRPDMELIASCLTDTGMEVLRTRYRELAIPLYAPWDLPGVTGRALDRVRPDVLVLEYTELWPQWMAAARARGIPLVLTNGRVSPGSVSAYRRLFAWTGNLLQWFHTLLLRSEADAARALSLGAPPDRVHVVPNSKFDALVRAPEADAERLSHLRRELGIEPDSQLLVCGSTHAGEESLLLDALGRLRTQHPALRLLIAPRYLQRADEVETLATRRGWSVGRRSRGPSGAPVLILDSMGELSLAYGLATVAFVGGTLVDRGGQNPLEPAARGVPVVCGPDLRNFAEALALLDGQGLRRVDGVEALVEIVGEWLENPTLRHEIGSQLSRLALSVRGGSERQAAAILACVDGGAVPRQVAS